MFDMEAMSPSMAILNYKWLQSIKYSITLSSVMLKESVSRASDTFPLS